MKDNILVRLAVALIVAILVGIGCSLYEPTAPAAGILGFLAGIVAFFVIDRL